MDPSYIAIVYAGLDERDLAFQWLEKAHEEEDFYLVWILAEPMLDGLRSDPRFEALMRETGLRDYIEARSEG